VEAAYGCRQLRVVDASGMKGEGLPTLFCGGDDLLIAKFQAGVISANLGPVQPSLPRARQPCHHSQFQRRCSSLQYQKSSLLLSLQYQKMLPAS
jgi:hypothetical protein